jgi:hypothetical protein
VTSIERVSKPLGWVDRASQATRQGALPLIRCGISALGSEGHERNITGAFDGCAKLTLVSSTIAGDPAWDDLTPLGNQVAQTLDILIVDVGDLV